MTVYKIDNPLPPGTRVYLPFVKEYGTIKGVSAEFYVIDTDSPVPLELAIADKWGENLTPQLRRLLEKSKKQYNLLVAIDEIESKE